MHKARVGDITIILLLHSLMLRLEKCLNKANEENTTVFYFFVFFFFKPFLSRRHRNQSAEIGGAFPIPGPLRKITILPLIASHIVMINQCVNCLIPLQRYSII